MNASSHHRLGQKYTILDEFSVCRAVARKHEEDGTAVRTRSYPPNRYLNTMRKTLYFLLKRVRERLVPRTRSVSYQHDDTSKHRELRTSRGIKRPTNHSTGITSSSLLPNGRQTTRYKEYELDFKRSIKLRLDCPIIILTLDIDDPRLLSLYDSMNGYKREKAEPERRVMRWFDTSGEKADPETRKNGCRIGGIVEFRCITIYEALVTTWLMNMHAYADETYCQET
jgi:hypothetical protein